MTDVTETLPQGALVRVRAIPGSAPWSSVRLGVSPGTQEPGHGGHRPRRSAATLAYACSGIFSRRSMTRRRVSASSRRSTSSSGDRALSACAAVAAAGDGPLSLRRPGWRAANDGSATRRSQPSARGARSDSSKRTRPGSRLRGPRRASHRLDAAPPRHPLISGFAGRPSQGID